MDDVQLFLAADKALSDVVAQIRDDQWSMAMPADFQTWNDDEITLREIINYHAFDEAWVPDTLAGSPVDDTTHSGDLLGDDPQRNYAEIVAGTERTVRGFAELDRVVHLSYGDFPAREYLQHISVFRGMRAHDVAAVIGADTTMPDELVQGLWDLLQEHAEEWREMGVFGPKIEVPESASLQDRLLGLTGREPDGPR